MSFCSMWKNAHSSLCLYLGLVFLLAGCGAGPRLMMPTPNVYLEPERNVYENLAPELKSTEVKLLYITDRTPEKDKTGNLVYGYGRSASLAYGTTVVDLGAEMDWLDLLEASRTQQRLEPVKLTMRDLTELGRGEDLPLPYDLVDGQIVEEPEWLARDEAATKEFRKFLVKQLELSSRKEVFIYVHGYRNRFKDAAFAMGEIWHFLGRIGVPIIYTWPAGYPGFFGYTYDRESSEFTIYHLREALKFIAALPEVEKINVVAHSRGADVAVAAIRELSIGARAADLDPRKEFKIHNLVLAAPDLDVEVTTQRMGGDKLALSVDRWTIYTSAADKAIGFASRLFASPRGRLGTFNPEDATKNLKAWMEFSKANFAVVDFPVIKGSVDSLFDRYGHSYFRNAPSVSSDLILMLRDDLDPGDQGRPLKHLGLKFWSIPPGYPAP